MSITAQNIFDWLMSIADELSSTGTINPTDTNDYKYRTPAILNMLQARLMKQGDIFSTHEISHKSAEMAYGSFDVTEYKGTELTLEGSAPAYGYYFEIDGEGTVYVEDYTSGWNIISTVTVTSSVTDFTAYKGILTPTAGATKSRIRLAGTYRYLIKNAGLFKHNFPLSRLPDYRPWVKKSMPSDFKSIDQIVDEYSESYIKDCMYKWEGKADLYIPWEYEGNIRIVYRPVPETIDAMTDTVQVDDVTARTTLLYALGMELYKNENETLYAHFRNEFETTKLEGKKKPPLPEASITNFYGGLEVN